jgi:hypothetical protein
MKRALALGLCAVLFLTGCSSFAVAPAATTQQATEAPTPSPTVEPTPSPTPTPTESPTPVPTPTPTPVPTSLTSGPPSGQEYKPVNVQIENQPQARPQAGMSEADIVYEVLMEGRSMTRFQCVFNDHLPKNVGPVRSCRIYFADIASEYKGVLAFFGGPDHTKANIYPKINKAVKDGNVQVAADGLTSKYGTKSGLYWRIKQRSAPHNVYTDITKLVKLLTKPVPAVSHFNFNADAVLSGDDVTKIEVKYPAVDTRYEYDAALRKYKRFIGKEPFIDANTKQQITVTNVIVQYAKTVGLGTSKGHIDVKLIGSGDAEVFVGGKHVKATWKRAKQADITRYYDASGKEIEILPGNTWVQIVPTGSKYVKFSK